MRKRAIRAFAVLVGVAGFLAAQMKIPEQPGVKPAPVYIGNPATVKPISAPAIPQNPFMGLGAWDGPHHDTYSSDTYFTGGPLGNKPEVFSSYLGTQTAPGAISVMVFTGDGRLIAVVVQVDQAAGTVNLLAVLLEADTLKPLFTLPLPSPVVTQISSKFRPAGVYAYLDNFGRLITGTNDRTIWVISHTATTLSHDATYGNLEIPESHSIEALQPDFFGRIWLTTKQGLVETLNGATGALIGKYQLPAGETIVNGHSADENGGVFIVSTGAMYRFDADSLGKPVVTWREPYDAGTHIKSGQVDIGSGSTPTLMGTEYVTITDNAQPKMNVLVYHRGKEVTGPRLHCIVPVFQGQSSNEQSLIATDKSIVVPNNFGYLSMDATAHGNTTKPGMARIDVEPYGCRTVWTNEEVVAPSVVNKMSVANGLIYSYTKPKGPANTDAWYFTALDFDSGAVVYSQLTGTGPLYNNHYAPVYLGPDGKTGYAGVVGGIVAIRDTK